MIGENPKEKQGLYRLCKEGDPLHIINLHEQEVNRLVIGDLIDYIHQCTGSMPITKNSINNDNNNKIIFCSPSMSTMWKVDINLKDSKESFAVSTVHENGILNVLIISEHSEGLAFGCRHLINKIICTGEGLFVKECNEIESPWIPQREWTLCCWIPDQVKGAFINHNVDKRVDVFKFDEKQLKNYISMMGYLGFNGVQLLDTCYNWGAFGSIDSYHEKLKLIAEIAHDLGQNVTLWVWGACFDGYGWNDNDAIYESSSGLSAYEDLKVRSVFEKYYLKYAELAQDVDQIIGHFYEPGLLQDPQDAAKYMKFLEQIMRDKNQNLKFAVDVWASPDEYIQALLEMDVSGYLFLDLSIPTFKHSSIDDMKMWDWKIDSSRNIDLGVWGWYTVEYESDQMTSMYVNGNMLKQIYNRIRTCNIDRPPIKYWSEMEAYHILNIFSLYVSGKLLWNPDLNSDELLGDISSLIWGSDDGLIIFETLKLIQDTRGGNSWEIYWWTNPQHQLGTDDPVCDFERAKKCIDSILAIIGKNKHVSKIPLPVKPDVILELILPHIIQIKMFAEFRIKMNKVKEAYSNGVDKDCLYKMIDDAWYPVPDFNTWIATFGQIEECSQERIVRELCDDIGIEAPNKLVKRMTYKMRFLQKMHNMQHSHTSPVKFSVNSFVVSNRPVYKGEGVAILEELVKDGVLCKNDNNTYILRNWKDYAFKGNSSIYPAGS